MLNKTLKMSEEIKEDPFEFLWNILKEVQKETKGRVGDNYYNWSEHYNNWIDIIRPIIRSSPSFGNSLLGVRFLEFNKIILWIQMCIHCGQYYSALRELRFLLEFILKAYYLDKKYPNSTTEFKIQNEERLIGRRLIDELDLPNEHRSKLKILYKELSEYTHPTKEELSPILSGDVGARVTFAFDKDFFNKCKEFTNKVVDVVFFIIIKEYNNIINELKKDNKLLTSLKELKCELTINCLNDL